MKDERIKNYIKALRLEKKVCVSTVSWCKSQIKLLEERIIIENENLKLINNQIKESKFL